MKPQLYHEKQPENEFRFFLLLNARAESLGLTMQTCHSFDD